MEQHYGQVVERVIRRNGYSISELARLTNVNRRSVYNWFNQKYLKSEIIYRIGCALNYDFSAEFPKLFLYGDVKPMQNVMTIAKANNGEPPVAEQVSESNFWKDKYINLLEEYNDLLRAYNDIKKVDVYRNNNAS